MTNQDYEKASVEAAVLGGSAEIAMTSINSRIERTERELERLYETRREIINHYGLNKPAVKPEPVCECEHVYKVVQVSFGYETCKCKLCGHEVTRDLNKPADNATCQHDWMLHDGDSDFRECKNCGTVEDLFR